LDDTDACRCGLGQSVRISNIQNYGKETASNCTARNTIFMQTTDFVDRKNASTFYEKKTTECFLKAGISS